MAPVNKTDLSVRQISERTGVGAETVRRWLRAGDLPSRQIGKKHMYRVRPQDLEAYLEQGQRI